MYVDSVGVVRMGFVVKRIKGRLYVYERFSINTGDGKRRVEYYIAPLEELVRIYQMYQHGLTATPRLHPKTLRRLAKDIVEEVITRQSYKPHTLNTYSGARRLAWLGRRPDAAEVNSTSSVFASKLVIPGALECFLDNRVLGEFREWLGKAGLSQGTIQYYCSTVGNKRAPDREKRVKAWRRFIEFLSETGRISYSLKLELLDKLKTPPRRQHYGQAAVPVARIKQYINAMEKLGLGWLARIMLGGARLSHILEMLRLWSRKDEVVEHRPAEGVLEPRLYCSGVFCRFYLGLTTGYKRCLYIYFPQSVLGQVRTLGVEYRSLKDSLHARGVEIGVFRDFATQRLTEQARLNSIPSEAAKFILSREQTVTGAHYLNTRDWADELFSHYTKWLRSQGLC